jgi:transcriptional regulator with XRE-family HTH domain
MEQAKEKPMRIRAKRATALGALVNEYRTRKGFTFMALAKATGLAYGTVCSIELGYGKAPSVNTAGLVCKVLKISPRKFMNAVYQDARNQLTGTEQA